LSNSEEHTWDQMYLEEYSKGKISVFGENPDRFVVWIAEYLKERGMSQSVAAPPLDGYT